MTICNHSCRSDFFECQTELSADEHLRQPKQVRVGVKANVSDATLAVQERSQPTTARESCLPRGSQAITMRVAGAVVLAPQISPTITRAIFAPPTDDGSIWLA